MNREKSLHLSDGEKLDNLIEEVHPFWTIAKFADEAGIKRTSMHELVKKESFDNVSISKISAVAKTLGMSVEEFLKRIEYDLPKVEAEVEEEYSRIMNNAFTKERNNSYLNIFVEESEKRSLTDVRYFGNVSAGFPQVVEGLLTAEQVKLPNVFLGKYKNNKDVFVMRVNGDSMNEVFPNNSLIVCLLLKDKCDIQEDDIVIFSYNNESSVKRYRTTATSIIFSPESDNKEFHDIVIPKDTLGDLKILAKVIAYHVVLD